MIEQRKYERVYNLQISARIFLRPDDNEGITCKIKDMSAGGVFFEHIEDIKVNKVIKISFDCNPIDLDFPSKLSAIVVRTEEHSRGHNIAVMFTKVPKKECKLLKKIITFHQSLDK